MAQTIDDYIFQIIETKRPKNVEQLMEFVQEDSFFCKKEILDRLVVLKNDKKIVLNTLPVYSANLHSYAVSTKLAWFWGIVIFTFSTSILFVKVPDSLFPMAYVRPILGTFFTLLLPGFSFIQAIFPANKLKPIERIGISIGTSLAFVSLDAFVLNFLPWKITLTSIVLSLSFFTILLATYAFLIQLSRFRKEMR